MLNSLVLSVTHQCTVKCKYCGVYAGPHVKERMKYDFMCRIIDEVKSFDVVGLVVFTGGEPFLLGEDLYKIVEYASQKGLITRIVTNAYWATSYEKAHEILLRMKNSGLTEINFSCDDFHQEFIPIENVKWANEAASNVGMPALIASKGLKNSKITPEYLEKVFGVKFAHYQKGIKNPDNNVLSYGVTVPVGWGIEKLKKEDLILPDGNIHWRGPCSSLFENIVINSSGDVSVCCGIGSSDIPETCIGNIHEKKLLELLKDANNDVILNWLALEGPYEIMRFIKKKSPQIQFNEQYVNMCHLCHDIFSRNDTREVLQESVDEKILTLALRRASLEMHRNDILEEIKSNK